MESLFVAQDINIWLENEGIRERKNSEKGEGGAIIRGRGLF